jgi:hypothetical protein
LKVGKGNLLEPPTLQKNLVLSKSYSAKVLTTSQNKVKETKETLIIPNIDKEALQIPNITKDNNTLQLD